MHNSLSREPRTHLVLVYDVALKVPVPAAVQVLLPHQLTDVQIFQPCCLGYLLAGRALPCARRSSHQNVGQLSPWGSHWYFSADYMSQHSQYEPIVELMYIGGESAFQAALLEAAVGGPVLVPTGKAVSAMQAMRNMPSLPTL